MADWKFDPETGFPVKGKGGQPSGQPSGQQSGQQVQMQLDTTQSVVDEIAGLARKASKPRVVWVPGHHEKKWIFHDGGIIEVPTDVPSISFLVDDIQSLVAAIQPYEESPEFDVSIWCSMSQMSVIACLDTKGARRHFIRMPLRFSQVLIDFQREVIGTRPQKLALRGLRRSNSCSDIAQRLSQIDWRTTTDLHQSRSAAGQDRMGKSVASAVQNNPIDRFVFTTPLVVNYGLGLEYELTVLVDYDFDRSAICFEWLPATLEAARVSTFELISKDLEEQFDKDRVYMGNEYDSLGMRKVSSVENLLAGLAADDR